RSAPSRCTPNFRPDRVRARACPAVQHVPSASTPMVACKRWPLLDILLAGWEHTQPSRPRLQTLGNEGSRVEETLAQHPSSGKEGYRPRYSSLRSREVLNRCRVARRLD